MEGCNGVRLTFLILLNANAEKISGAHFPPAPVHTRRPAHINFFFSYYYNYSCIYFCTILKYVYSIYIVLYGIVIFSMTVLSMYSLDILDVSESKNDEGPKGVCGITST